MPQTLHSFILGPAMLLALFGLARASESDAPPATIMARCGKPLFADDFQRAEAGDRWTTSVRSYSIRDGVLVTGQRPDAGHPAVCRVAVPMKDAVIDFRFKFAGGAGLSLVLNDRNLKTSHAGHVCRIQISPTAVTLGDDCEGAMKLGIYELWKDPARKSEVEVLVESRKRRVPIMLNLEAWHRLTVEIIGDEMTAAVDGKPVAYLKSPGIGHPVKNYWGLTTQGRFIEVDDLRAWSAVPDPAWPERREQLFGSAK